jgi:hypothetical protein
MLLTGIDLELALGKLQFLGQLLILALVFRQGVEVDLCLGHLVWVPKHQEQVCFVRVRLDLRHSVDRDFDDVVDH